MTRWTQASASRARFKRTRVGAPRVRRGPSRVTVVVATTTVVSLLLGCLTLMVSEREAAATARQQETAALAHVQMCTSQLLIPLLSVRSTFGDELGTTPRGFKDLLASVQPLTKIRALFYAPIVRDLTAYQRRTGVQVHGFGESGLTAPRASSWHAPTAEFFTDTRLVGGAAGIDGASSPFRQDLIDAVNSGLPVLGEPYLQAGAPPIAVVTVPVFASALSVATAAQRWHAIRGWIGAVVLVQDILPAAGSSMSVSIGGKPVVGKPQSTFGQQSVVAGRLVRIAVHPSGPGLLVPIAVVLAGLLASAVIAMLLIDVQRRRLTEGRLVVSERAAQLAARSARRKVVEQESLRRISDAASLSTSVGAMRGIVEREAAAGFGASNAWLGSRSEGLTGASDLIFSTGIDAPPGTWSTLSIELADDERSDEAWPYLERVASVVGIAMQAVDARLALERAALTDPLTGAGNRRALQLALERGARVAPGVAHSLIAIDLDNLKEINDSLGHAMGDEVLRSVAEIIVKSAPHGATVCRTGGDEFSVVVASGADSAAGFVDVVQQGIAERTALAGGLTTISAGICEFSATVSDHASIMRRADCALYRAKADGRSKVRTFDDDADGPEDDDVQPPLRRSPAVAERSLRALARAIDAKDPATFRHSERVAELARSLAARLGWSAERAADLHAVALVHDVGKIGIRDAVLSKPGPLTKAEFSSVKCHPEIGAHIAADALPPYQLAWLRGHHERYDGTGYPDGLARDEIPDGARILALADTWDAMTSARPYHRAKSRSKALREVEAQAGRKFDPTVVAALAECVALIPITLEVQTPLGETDPSEESPRTRGAA